MLLERIVRGIVILVVASLFLEALSWFTAPVPPCLIQTTNEEQAAHHYDDCPTLFPGSLILLGRADHFIERHDKSIVAAFTVVLAISTIGLWLATVGLHRSTHALWEAGERQARDTRILERAYLTIEGDGIRAFLDGTDRLSCGIRYHNNGNLPAEEVHMFHDRKFSANRWESDLPIGEVGKGSIYIAPKAIALGGAQHLSKQELLKWKPRQGEPENWLFVWGRVTYLDGFGDARFIDFCHRYNLSGSGVGGVMDASACRYHEYGNRTGKLPKGAHRPAT
jgi:hypothetical protein